jgi:hypothetical protein
LSYWYSPAGSTSVSSCCSPSRRCLEESGRCDCSHFRPPRRRLRRWPPLTWHRHTP